MRLPRWIGIIELAREGLSMDYRRIPLVSEARYQSEASPMSHTIDDFSKSPCPSADAIDAINKDWLGPGDKISPLMAKISQALRLGR